MPSLPSATLQCCVNAGWGSHQIPACSDISILRSDIPRLFILGSGCHFVVITVSNTLMPHSRAPRRTLKRSGFWWICILNHSGWTSFCLPLIKNKQGEPKMTPCFAVLVKRVAELREAKLKVCHSAEEFTLRWICPLGRREKLAFECPQLADPNRESADGKIFIL
jgi:hypothetical protein